MLESPEAHPQSSDCATAIYCKTPEDGWLAPPVIVNGIIAVVGFAALLLQGWTTRRALNEAQRSGNAAAEQAQHAKAALDLAKANAEESSEATTKLLAISDRNAAAAEDSASAAKRSAVAAERSLRDIERPRLVPVPMAISLWPDVDDRLVLLYHTAPNSPVNPNPMGRVNIQNYGRSPAWITKLAVEFEVLKADDVTDHPTYRHFVRPNGVPIAPYDPAAQNYCPLPDDLKITVGERMAMGGNPPTHYVLFYGLIEYRGVFSDVPPYVTRFCFEILPEGGMVPGGRPDWIEQT